MTFAKLRIACVVLLFIVCVSYGQEDSLRSALKAVDRRQRDLSQISRYSDRYGNAYERPNELEYLGNNDYQDHAYETSNDASSLDYLEYEPYPEVRPSKKSISSSFRERVEQDKEKQLEEIARLYLDNISNRRDAYKKDEYDELIRELLEKYKNRHSYARNPIYPDNDIKKRQYYPSFGLDSIGLRKRSRYFEPEGPAETFHLLSYAPRDDVVDRLEENNDADAANIDYTNANKFPRMERKYSYGSDGLKRFPVSKRSSPYTDKPDQGQKEKKRSTLSNKPPNSPKIENKNENIKTTPSQKNTPNTTVSPSTAKPKTTKAAEFIKPTSNLNNTSSFNPKESRNKTVKKARAETKEVPFGVDSNKPLKMKKKSINWSDYFGIDRRKKSDNDLDSDWLLERYHKSVASEDKRDAKYQLKSFKIHDEPEPKSNKLGFGKEKEKKKTYPSDDKKIDDMDTKLKSMEDSIIDDAIKFTGAHEGITDSKEIQEVKDEVISRLAAAYSLEKMRRALSEYKLSIAKEKQRMLQEQKNGDIPTIKKKRLSVPRKEAIDDERDDNNKADNDIKCGQADEDCLEQNYKTPTDILEQHSYETGSCPKIERACGEISTVLGHYARVFETACNMHQMCLLCGNNNWFAPTRPCNVLFLSKTYELCSGNPECQREAQRSVRYMLDVNRSLRSEPLEDCDLICPENR